MTGILPPLSRCDRIARWLDRRVIALRDWMRGYTDADMASYINKRNQLASSGQMIEMTPAELIAGVEFDKQRAAWYGK